MHSCVLQQQAMVYQRAQARVTHEGARKEENREEYRAAKPAQQGKKNNKDMLDGHFNT